jgi:hypothetical protein
MCHSRQPTYRSQFTISHTSKLIWLVHCPALRVSCIFLQWWTGRHVGPSSPPSPPPIAQPAGCKGGSKGLAFQISSPATGGRNLHGLAFAHFSSSHTLKPQRTSSVKRPRRAVSSPIEGGPGQLDLIGSFTSLWVLLSVRTAWREDSECSPAAAVFGAQFSLEFSARIARTDGRILLVDSRELREQATCFYWAAGV